MVEAIGDGGAIVGFAAVRAHHADVGGMSPGSMPQGATELFQEGHDRSAGAHRATWRCPSMTCCASCSPTSGRRTSDTATSRRSVRRARPGARAGSRCARVRRPRGLDAACDALLDYTRRRALARIAELGRHPWSRRRRARGRRRVGRGRAVAVEVSVRDGRLRLDFTGTSPAVRGNVNCPRSVTRAAAVFVLRTLLDDDVPTNDGIADALELVIPLGCAIDARWPSAVAAGNVEMSQRITDTIFAALGDAGVAVPAQGQGTMNNITFGGAGWTFYETLGGGQGASPRGPGPSAVHVGMSNTRNTPIESLEHAYPIRIDEYSVRRGSGGAGQHAAATASCGAIACCERCTVTLVTERRRHAPSGAAGGSPGTPGVNQLNGQPIPAKCRLELQPGDVVTVMTPGWRTGGASDRRLDVDLHPLGSRDRSRSVRPERAVAARHSASRASSSSSLRSGLWWNSTSVSTPLSSASATASPYVECPHPRCDSYSSSVYVAS